MTMTKTLCVEKLNASYSNKQVFTDVSLSLQTGTLVCLCGPNGCGKSTLLKILCGLGEKSLSYTATKNPCLLQNGKTTFIKDMNRKLTARNISLLLQNETSLWNFSVLDYVLQGRFCHTVCGNYSGDDQKLAQEAINQLGISKFTFCNVNELSGGEFQKVRIARSLCQNPSFLLLDEPASSLDFVYEPKLMEELKKLSHSKNLGILVTLHDINLAVRYADKLILLPSGKRPFYGDVDQVFTEENIEQTFGSPCKIYNHPVYKCPQVSV